MSKTIINEEEFPRIVERYNDGGKTAAYDFLRSEFGIKHPYFVMNRIKSCGRYSYDPDADRFLGLEIKAAESVFMDLDQLCSSTITEAPVQAKITTDMRPAAMEKLVHELISDRLLTLSRYIVLDSSTRTITIDQSSLSADGYQIVTHYPDGSILSVNIRIDKPKGPDLAS